MSQPEYETPILMPSRGEIGAGDGLWTPTGVEHVGGWPVGIAPESEQMVWKIEFILTFRGYKRSFSILWEEGDSEQQTVDLMGWTAERTALAIGEMLDRQGTRVRPEDLALRSNVDARRQLAGAFRTYRKWAKKKKASTTGATVFKGLK